MRKRVANSEEGFVLVLMAFFMVVLVGLAGLCVDLGQWYLAISRLQNASDAAALAGAVYLPENPDLAKQAAIDSLKQNGFTNASDIVDISPVPGKPGRLRVQISTTVNAAFVGLLSKNLQQMHFSRSAVGQYRGAMAMGSPSNVLGIEPAGFPQWNNIAGSQREYWLQTDGGQEPKVNGDRWGTKMCDLEDEANSGHIYGCTNDKNDEYAPEGQTYVVHIPGTTTGHVEIQAFDVANVDVENDESDYMCDGHNIGGLVGSQLPTDPPDLYNPGDDSPYCTQDSLYDDEAATDTSVTVYTPKASAGGSQPVSGCDTDFPGYTGDLVKLVNQTPPGYQTTAKAFRHWYTLCNLPIGAGATAGDYRITIKSSANTSGVNSFSLRAAVINNDGSLNVAETTGINVFADGRLVIASNAEDTAINPEFYLVKLYSNQAGETLNVNLYDVGDSDDPGTLQLEPPPDAMDGATPMTNFGQCEIEGPLPTNQSKGIVPDCTVHNLQYETYNGQLLKFRIPIPVDYKCNDTDPNGCWVRIKLSYGAQGYTSDTTSWEVNMTDSPIRLVPDQ